jgi:transcriptional regulator with XRE-family HTH domain
MSDVRRQVKDAYLLCQEEFAERRATAMNTGESLGELLRRTREARGLNLSEAAREIGAARTAYRLWERDAAVPAPDQWKGLALWCEVPLWAILRLAGLLSADEEADLLRLAARAHRRTR